MFKLSLCEDRTARDNCGVTLKKEEKSRQIPDNPHPERSLIDRCIDEFEKKIILASTKYIPNLKHKVISGAQPNKAIRN